MRQCFFDDELKDWNEAMSAMGDLRFPKDDIPQTTRKYASLLDPVAEREGIKVNKMRAK